MNSPKITVVTPSLNQGRYLESTICSILEQRYPNLEYLIIDGGSRDDSIEIIKRYERHISYWISEEDGGQSEAINKGLSRATGDIITWVNSDDMLQPGILSKIPSYFDRDDIGLVFGRSISFGDNVIERISSSDIVDIGAKTLGSVAFPQPAAFFRRSILRELGYLDESLHYGMDYDLFVRIALNYEIRPVNEVVSRNRYHSESKSVSKVFGFAADWAKVFSKVLRSFDFTDEIVSELKDLGIYHDGTDYYEVCREFDDSDIQRAYVYFLQEQAQLYYGAYRMDQAKAIVKRIKQLDSNIYDEYGLAAIYIRSSYVPISLLRFAKRLRSILRRQKQYGW